MPKTIAIFCGSNEPANDFHRNHTRRIANQMASQGWNLVYGGGDLGLMGLVAKVFVEHGRSVTAFTPQGLMREKIHPAGVKVHYVEDMFARKDNFMRLADAFVILPGGWGTLDELSEVLTHRYFADVAPKVQHIHNKPTVMVSYDEVEQLLISYLNARMRQGYIKPQFKGYLFTGLWEDCFPYLQQHLAETPEAIPA